jgi:SAM-dependent methyltransferase
MDTNKIQQLLQEKGGIRLDIGGGNNPNPGCINIDILPLEKVDIVHNIELTPWPLPNECVLQAFASHLFEHISPSPPDARFEPLVKLLIAKKVFTEEEAHNHRLLGNSGATFMRVMDEIWRILKPGGQLAFVVPYAESHGMYQDPTHCNFLNETTMCYFDPLDPSGLYQFYKPQPWKIDRQYVQRTGLLEVLLSKREDIPEYKSPRKVQDIIDEQAMPKRETKEVRMK